MSETDKTDKFIGQNIDGKYTILEALGRGGMGSVYRARQDAINRDVAIKFLSISSFTESREKFVERFKREAETASQIRHPSAVTIYDYGVTSILNLNECPYLVMECIAGTTLKQELDKGLLPAGRIVPLIVQVCGALEEAHSLGIVHRDLKPENIMVATGREGYEWAYVLDFGIAKKLEEENDDVSLTKTGNIMGTPKYMAPEQVWQKEISARSDVYSLAVVLYECISGKLPIEGTSLMDIAFKMSSQDPEPISKQNPDISIPKSLEKEILRALSREPEARPQSASEFGANLVKASPAEYQFNSGSLAFSRTQRALSGRSGWGYLAVGIALCASLLLAVLFSRDGDLEPPSAAKLSEPEVPQAEEGQGEVGVHLRRELEEELKELELESATVQEQEMERLEAERIAAVEAAKREREAELARIRAENTKLLEAEKERIKKLQLELEAQKAALAESRRKQQERAAARKKAAESKKIRNEQPAVRKAPSAPRKSIARPVVKEVPKPRPTAAVVEKKEEATTDSPPRKRRRRCGPTWCP